MQRAEELGMASRDEWNVTQEVSPEEEGEAPRVCMPSALEVQRGGCIGIICLETSLASRKIIFGQEGGMRQLSQEGTSVCKSWKGLSGNQIMRTGQYLGLSAGAEGKSGSR